MAEEAVTAKKLEEVTLDIGLSKEEEERIRRLAIEEKKRAAEKQEGLIGIYNRLNNWVQGFGRIKLQEKVSFFQLMAVLVNAGVPLDESLLVLEDQSTNPKMELVIANIRTRVQAGSTLSEAMEGYPAVFAEAQVGMVKSAERTGQMKSVLSQIAKEMEKSASVISKVKGAMIYPVAVILIMLGAVYIVLVAVIPKITELFTQGGLDLPRSTQILIALSQFVQSKGLLIIIPLILLVVGASFYKKTKKGKYAWDWFLIHVPIFGKLNRKVAVARFSRNLSNLMRSGITILDSLEINANAIGNEVYKRRILLATEDVSQGIPLGENLKSSGFLFPRVVASMIAVGESTAAVDEVAEKIADYYDEEVDNTVKGLSKLMEPVILVVMGIVVGGLVSAVMQPIISLTDVSTVL